MIHFHKSKLQYSISISMERQYFTCNYMLKDTNIGWLKHTLKTGVGRELLIHVSFKGFKIQISIIGWQFIP